MVRWLEAITGPWGLSPVAMALAALLSVRVGAIFFQARPTFERLLAGITCVLAYLVLGVRVLGWARMLGPPAILLLIAFPAVLCTLVNRGSRLDWRPWSALTRVTALPVLAVLAGLALVVTSAVLLPIWQWDSIGYHLPFVAFALQGRSFADVPRDALYLSSYPHNVELLCIAFRAMLPDDRVLDLAQAPLGLVGAYATACIARRMGARPEHACLAGLCWLTVPVVLLQLATDYVDVASASFLLLAIYWVMSAPSGAVWACAGASLGLYLGSKPNAPLPTSLLFGLLVYRSRKLQSGWALGGVLALALLLGVESYVVNLLEHGNPVWPVAVRLGPWAFPGRLSVDSLLAAGAAAPRPHGPLLERVLESWTAILEPPVFDSRLGGFGSPFLLALPFSVYVAIKRRQAEWVVPVVATLASPEPSTARFVLAFPAMVFAFAAAGLRPVGGTAELMLSVGLAGIFGATIAQTVPGFVGEGPPLTRYFAMSEAERLRAVGANGPPTPLVDARETLGAQESAAFDAAFDLPYLLWSPDLSHSVYRVPDDAGPDDVDRLLVQRNVRLLVAGDQRAAGALARSQPGRFSPLFHCKSDPCTVFRVR